MRRENSYRKLRYFVAYKPYGTICRFTTDNSGNPCLRDLQFAFQKDVYPVGRLDRDSEGLLLLTNDKRINRKLLHPTFGHEREYWVQVEGCPGIAAIKMLENGMDIKVGKRLYRTRPARVKLLTDPPRLPARIPPVRYRKTVPTSWLSIILTEGKNRQVRKMTAKAGFPTLRLVRSRIGYLRLGNMLIGEVREIGCDMFYERLGLIKSCNKSDQPG